MVEIKVPGGRILIVMKEGHALEGLDNLSWRAEGENAQKLLDYNILEALDDIEYSLGFPEWDLAWALAPRVGGTIVTKRPKIRDRLRKGAVH